MNTRVYIESVNLSGTIRWIGFLEGLESERAGIELDYPPLVPSHSGEYRGTLIFACRKNCGILIKSSKLVKTQSLKSAIHAKYIESDTLELSPSDPKFPTPILVGEEKAKKFFSLNIFHLDEISLDNTSVSFDPNTDPSFLPSFSSLSRLSLCGNLLGNLDSVAEICRLIPSLNFFDVSGNRLAGCVTNNTSGGSHSLSSLMMDDCQLVIDDAFIQWIKISFPNLKKLSIRKNDIRPVNISFPQSLNSLTCSNPLVPVDDIFAFLQKAIPTVEFLDIDNIHFEVNQIRPLPSLSHLHVYARGWDTFKAISTNFPNLYSLIFSHKSFYDSSPKTRSIIIVSLPHLASLNHSIIRPHQRLEAFKYVSSLWMRKDEIACSVLSETIQSHLSLKTENEPVSNKVQPAEPNKTYWNLIIRSGTNIPIRVPKSVTLLEFCGLVARKISWPLKLSELSLSVRPPHGDESDIMLLADNSDLACVDDDWHVYTAVL